MISYPQEFNSIVENAKSYNRPWRVAVAGSDNENILKGVFAAQEAGFAEPILIGSFKKTRAMLDALGLADKKYDFYPVTDNTSPVQYAIEKIGRAHV
jgi:phosphotransacetylase